jgi:hypothetical protein
MLRSVSVSPNAQLTDGGPPPAPESPESVAGLPFGAARGSGRTPLKSALASRIRRERLTNDQQISASGPSDQSRQAPVTISHAAGPLDPKALPFAQIAAFVAAPFRYASKGGSIILTLVSAGATRNGCGVITSLMIISPVGLHSQRTASSAGLQSHTNTAIPSISNTSHARKNPTRPRPIRSRSSSVFN